MRVATEYDPAVEAEKRRLSKQWSLKKNVYLHYDKIGDAVVDGNGSRICALPNYNGHGPLLAASPDMYEAIRTAIDELTFIQDEYDVSYIVQGLATALKKAEG
jgi:hypothetical protein